MPTFVIVLTVLLVLIFAVLAWAATRPDSFSVQRSTIVGVAPDRVFGHLNDFHNWPGWSPWEHLDPQMQRTHSGAQYGRGAVYEWNGNKKVGAGRMEILESAPPVSIRIKLDFLRPFPANNLTVFSFAPQGGGTEVTWTMTGSSPFLLKVMGLFVSMDRMVGKDFERGLANLKALVEK